MQQSALDNLEPTFKAAIEKVLQLCLDDGFELRPYCGVRDPWEQARLWRRSRSKSEVQHGIEFLKSVKAPFLASILEDVGPQPADKWRTSALPGQSWHQWGLAVDCVVMEKNGNSNWNAGHPGYQSYAQHAHEAGLVPGLFWQKMDAVHVQATIGRVIDANTWPTIDAAMRERF